MSGGPSHSAPEPLGALYRTSTTADVSVGETRRPPYDHRMPAGIERAQQRLGMERFGDAWASAQAALGLFRQLGDDMWYAHTQRDIGLLHLRQGRPGEALAPLTEAIEGSGRPAASSSGAWSSSSRYHNTP